MKHKKEITMIISSALCFALGFALLLSGTLGRYIGELNGYTKFEVERFNAKISVYDPQTNGEASAVLTTNTFYPGMESLFGETGDENVTDTAAYSYFKIENGTDFNNVASMAIQYTIRVRTARSLPLKYTLKYGDNYYETKDTPEEITIENGEHKFEYLFNPLPKGSSGASAENEAKFDLGVGTKENPIVYNTHALVIEWNEESYDSSYMNELELIEIVATVTALSRLDVGDNPSVGNNSYYSDGVIFLRPPEDASNQSSYSYSIDIRSFHKQELDSVNNTYTLSLNNGVGLGITHDSESLSYDMLLKVPYDLTENGYGLSIYKSTDENMVNLKAETPEYRVYNMLDGTYEPYIGDPLEFTVEDTESGKKKLYEIYRINLNGDNILINNTINSTGSLQPYVDFKDYTLEITKPADISEEDKLAFLNKIEVLVDVTFGTSD